MISSVERPVAADADAARAAAAQPVPRRLAAHRPGRQAHDQQGHAELRVQHGRQPDLPEPGQAAHGVDRPRGARRQHPVLQAARRGHLVLPPPAADLVRLPRAVRVHRAGIGNDGVAAESSSGCSSAASTACAASTSARSGRRCRDRSSCSAATRACCSTPSTMITIAEPGAPGALLRCRPGPRLRRALRVEGRRSLEVRPPTAPPLHRSVRDVVAGRSERARCGRPR